MAASVDIRLKRTNKIYYEGENLAGVVIFDSKTETRHEGISLTVEGSVNMQLSSKNVGIFEAFYNSAKPVPLIGYAVEMKKTGKIPAGRTEIPFEMPLKAKMNKNLYETYHGVFISIQYVVKCEVKRSMLNKDLQKVVEFMIESRPSPPSPALELKPVTFAITPESLQNVKIKSRIPRFKVLGQLDNSTCRLADPFLGELVVDYCEAPIRSVELQLVRVETCGCAEGYAKEATEVQNIQIGEGDVCRKLPIPIYMVFPRLFTCPTLVTNNFKIEFEVNIIVIFEDNHLITENFPINLVRC
jgi:hypothetical protein